MRRSGESRYYFVASVTMQDEICLQPISEWILVENKRPSALGILTANETEDMAKYFNVHEMGSQWGKKWPCRDIAIIIRRGARFIEQGGQRRGSQFCGGASFQQPNPFFILYKLFKQIIYLINPNHNFFSVTSPHNHSHSPSSFPSIFQLRIYTYAWDRKQYWFPHCKL